MKLTTPLIASSLVLSFSSFGNSPLQLNTPQLISGSAGSSIEYTLKVTEQYENLRFETGGGVGDLDMYINYGNDASVNNYECSSTSETNIEVCTVRAKKGTYSVVIDGYTDYDNVKLSAISIDSNDQQKLTIGTPHKNIHVQENKELVYQVTVPQGNQLKVIQSGGMGDADLYVKYDMTPSTSRFDCRSFNRGNEEFCLIDLTQAGTYFIMLNAYKSVSGLTLEVELN